MFIKGCRITSFAIAGVLCLGLSRKAVAQAADTVSTGSIETTTATVYRVKEPAKAPMAKSEVKGHAPSKNAIWVPGFWNLQGNPSTGARAGWDWVPGKWLSPPARNAHWFPAHWGWSEGWWSWIPGHWTQGANWIPSTVG
jgi:hypothetical protein